MGHRARLASTIAYMDLVGSLIAIASREDLRWRVQLASFIRNLLQPDLDFLPGVERAVLQLVHRSSAELRSSLSWHADELWQVLSSVPGTSALSQGFLKDCSAIAFGSPGAVAECSRLIYASLQNGSLDEATLAELSILAANAELQPLDSEKCGLAPIYAGLSESQLGSTLQQLENYRGPVKQCQLAPVLTYLRCRCNVFSCVSEDMPLIAAADASFAACLPPEVPVSSSKAPPASSRASARELLEDAPPEFCCAIDGRFLVDPVRSPSGHTFERSVLAECLSSNGGHCPITMMPLTLQICQRDVDLRQAALRWVRERRAQRACGRQMLLRYIENGDFIDRSGV